MGILHSKYQFDKDNDIMVFAKRAIKNKWYPWEFINKMEICSYPAIWNNEEFHDALRIILTRYFTFENTIWIGTNNSEMDIYELNLYPRDLWEFNSNLRIFWEFSPKCYVPSNESYSNTNEPIKFHLQHIKKYFEAIASTIINNYTATTDQRPLVIKLHYPSEFDPTLIFDALCKVLINIKLTNDIVIDDQLYPKDLNPNTIYIINTGWYSEVHDEI